MSSSSVSPAASPAPGQTARLPDGAKALPAGPSYVVLTGNPNCGKTTLFNALTGLRAKVGNYAGVTVERKEGRLLGAPAELNVRLLDLPGTYSLSPQSLDEQISRDVLLNRIPDLPAPSLIVIVVDASNLQRNLYYATQVIELGHPTIIALNMVDVARDTGHEIDTQKLAAELGVPVVPVVASQGTGLPELRAEILMVLQQERGRLVRANDSTGSSAIGAARSRPRHFWDLPEAFRKETEQLAALLAQTFEERRDQAAAEALLLLTNEKALASSLEHYPDPVQTAVAGARQRLDGAGFDWRSAPIEARYQKVAAIQRASTVQLSPPGETFSDRLDKLLTHKVWGTLIFIAIMTLMFESIFTFAHWPMEKLQSVVDLLGSLVAGLIPPGELNSLLVDGVIAGVGAVVVFLPQILILFLFIGFLEDTGYMARAAFLMDRLMSKVGLHGKSFIPMLSSFACAIPGIMATRTIESPKDRLVTIMVSPLMSCSARLPVYTLLIAACIPRKLQGLTMMSMYLLGIVVALLMAWLFKKTLLKGEVPLLIMELPPYKRPLLRVVLRHMWDRSKLFLRRAGTVILGINILLWFLATYPHSPQIERDFAHRRAALAANADRSVPSDQSRDRPPAVASAKAGEGASAAAQGNQTFRAHLDAVKANVAPSPSPSDQSRDREEAPGTVSRTPAHETDISSALAALNNEEAGQKLRHSFAGRLGRFIEPAIAPLGFDWKMGIGIVSSFAAREVFVSTMATVENVGKYDRSTSSLADLEKAFRAERRPDGSPVYTTRTGLALMVFYVFALQCVSTVAVVRRETNSWKWPAFQWIYMGVLAWVLAFVTWHLGGMLGWG